MFSILVTCLNFVRNRYHKHTHSTLTWKDSCRTGLGPSPSEYTRLPLLSNMTYAHFSTRSQISHFTQRRLRIRLYPHCNPSNFALTPQHRQRQRGPTQCRPAAGEGSSYESATTREQAVVSLGSCRWCVTAQRNDRSRFEFGCAAIAQFFLGLRVETYASGNI